MNKILLVFDEKFKVNKNSFGNFLKKNADYLEFEIGSNISLNSGSLTKPDSFNFIEDQIKEEREKFDVVFCFTDIQYEDNYFIHEHNGLLVCSFWAWPHLTNLSKNNGLLYFIVDYLAIILDSTGFRHYKLTGCIYDFLANKTDIDDGMRQARICPNCLDRISKNIRSDEQVKMLEDLKKLMNLLSDSSKWNQDILLESKAESSIIQKRKSKEKDKINIVIASPGDTQAERNHILDKLEIQFRRGNHENHCSKRLIVHGWEDLASQAGYPQDIINKQIINKIDFVIAIFKHKLGTPTIDINTGQNRAESGTVEELLTTLDNTKREKPLGMVYFYSKAPILSLDSNDFDTIKQEWDKLSTFKKDISKKMIYKPYTELYDLLQTIIIDLENNIKDYFE
ncbi:MAG: hypothetical protein LBG15_03490 [Dysgonamonadaceae bacterium]|jgi:hypothetical protein|nr:hypothetical protein [Dysgonamonadaceae bacterium]